MGELAQLSLDRVRGQLPAFPGATLGEKLRNARGQAHMVLQQYVPDLKFDVTEARDVMSQVNAWVERNRADLEKAMRSPGQSLPEYLVLNMGSAERVQQWVIANYTVAAQGMGPWTSGKIDQLVADPGSDVSEQWALIDGHTRLNVFAMILKMERDGELAYVFRGQPLDGLGNPVIPVWAIIVVLVSFAAIVAYFYLESRKLEINNQLMRDICTRAQKEGDQATVDKCIEATRDLQISSPSQTAARELARAAAVIVGGYLIVRYGVPWASKQMSKRSAP